MDYFIFRGISGDIEREVLLFTCGNKDAVVRTYGLSPVLDLDLRMHVKVLN